jgi:hypothetical protein
VEILAVIVQNETNSVPLRFNDDITAFVKNWFNEFLYDLFEVIELITTIALRRLQRLHWFAYFH